MKRLFLVTVMMFLFVCGLVEASPIITIYSPENITYLRTEATTLDLNWSSPSNLTYASYSLNGASNITLSEDDDTEDSYSCEGSFAYPCAEGVDEIWSSSSYARATSGTTAYIYENTTLNSTYGENINWTAWMKINNGPGCYVDGTSQVGCWNGTAWQGLLSFPSYSSGILSTRIPPSCISENQVQIKTCVYFVVPIAAFADYVEGKIVYVAKNSSTFSAPLGANKINLYVTDDAAQMNSTTLYFTVGGIYYVDVINETDFTTPVYSDITVTNGTTTLNYDNVTSTSFTTAEIIGDIIITATASNGLFEPRSFEDTFTFGENKSHTFYLPLTSTGSYINLNIMDALGLEINGATVTTSKRNGLTYTEIDQSTTDETGAIIVFMETGISHKIDVTKTGYLNKTQYITATLSSYDITLSQSTTYINDTTELAGVTVYLTPTQTVLRENDAEEFVVTITSNSTLDWWSVDYLQDGASISGFTNYTADSNGGTNTTTLNTTNRNGTIVSRIQLQVEGYGLRTYETNYTIYEIEDSDFSLSNIFAGIYAKDFGNYGVLVVGFLALIITILIMATIGFEYSLTTLIGMIVLGLFVYMEWLDRNVYYLALVGILAFIFIRRSI